MIEIDIMDLGSADKVYMLEWSKSILINTS